jgi:hypothetical protein
MTMQGFASALLIQSPFSPGGAFTRPTSATTGGTSTLDGGSFSASLALHIAGLRSQLLDSLAGAAFGSGTNGSSRSVVDLLIADKQPGAELPASATTDRSAGILSPTGRNTTLFDPESAYRMMSVINNSELAYKAQFSGLSEMKDSLTEMQQDAANLATLTATSGNGDIQFALQNFADRYNEWVRRFDANVQSGGTLAGVQAAEVSRYEMEQSVTYRFHGARDGLHGMDDLGLRIDPLSGLATLDSARLDSVLAGNKPGVVNTVREFAANFSRSAELLNSADNFILNRLSRLDNVIRYIDDNTPALQAEFGLGDTARPSSQAAKALAAYERIQSIAH